MISPFFYALSLLATFATGFIATAPEGAAGFFLPTTSSRRMFEIPSAILRPRSNKGKGSEN